MVLRSVAPRVPAELVASRASRDHGAPSREVPEVLEQILATLLEGLAGLEVETIRWR
jgi:hypothetical protein